MHGTMTTEWTGNRQQSRTSGTEPTKEESPGSNLDKERETQQQPRLQTPTEHGVDPPPGAAIRS